MSKLDDFLLWVVITAIGGFLALVRRVFTNHTEIKMLKTDLDAREARREESNRAIQLALQQVKDDVLEVKEEVKYLRRKKDEN